MKRIRYQVRRLKIKRLNHPIICTILSVQVNMNNEKCVIFEFLLQRLVISTIPLIVFRFTIENRFTSIRVRILNRGYPRKSFIFLVIETDLILVYVTVFDKLHAAMRNFHR